FLVYALGIEGGFSYIFRGTVVTIVVLLAARLVIGGIRRAMAHGFSISPELRERFPTLEEHANRYLPILRGLLVTLVWLVAAVAILEAWGIRAFAWVTSDAGAGVLGSAVKIVIVV